MTMIRYLITVEVPDDASGRDVLITNHRRIREDIERLVESEYPDATVDVQWLGVEPVRGREDDC